MFLCDVVCVCLFCFLCAVYLVCVHVRCVCESLPMLCLRVCVCHALYVVPRLFDVLFVCLSDYSSLCPDFSFMLSSVCVCVLCFRVLCVCVG